MLCKRKDLPKGITVYNDNKKCDSGNYDLSNLENTVIDNLIGFQENNDSLLKIINGNNQPTIDTSSFKKQISQIDKKIQKNSDLYLNDFITMDELKNRTDSLQAEKKLLKAKINENKFNDSTDVFELVKKQLGSIPINELSYDNKKKIVNNLVSKVDVTADNVDIIFKFQLA